MIKYTLIFILMIIPLFAYAINPSLDSVPFDADIVHFDTNLEDRKIILILNNTGQNQNLGKFEVDILEITSSDSTSLLNFQINLEKGAQTRLTLPLIPSNIDEKSITLQAIVTPPKDSAYPYHFFDSKTIYVDLSEILFPRPLTAIKTDLDNSISYGLDKNQKVFSDEIIQVDFHLSEEQNFQQILVINKDFSLELSTTTEKIYLKSDKFEDLRVILTSSDSFMLSANAETENESVRFFAVDRIYCEYVECISIDYQENQSVVDSSSFYIVIGVISAAVSLLSFVFYVKPILQNRKQKIIYQYSVNDGVLETRLSATPICRQPPPNTPEKENLHTIKDIVKFTDEGFSINSSKMEKEQFYHFEHDGNIYQIKLDSHGKLRMRLLD